MESRTINAKRNIVWGLANKIVLLFVPFVTRTIIIKKLGADYLGLSSLFTSILQVLNLSEMGFSSAIVFSMYKPIAESDNTTISAILAFYRKIYKYIGAFILGVGLILIPFIPRLINGGWPDDVNIYALYCIYLVNTVISYLLFGYKSALLLAFQRNDVEVKITTVVFLFQYIFQIGFLYIINNFYVYSSLFLVFTIIGNLVRSLVVNHLFPQFRKTSGILDKNIEKEIFKRVAGAFVQKVCAVTRNSLDSIFLSLFLGLTTITMYGNYYYILSSIHGFLWIIIVSISAGVGDSIARETIEKNEYDLRKFSFLYAWISGWCTVCLLCLYQPFMKIWMGEELMFSMTTVIICCSYFYSLTIGDVKSAYTTGAGLWWEARYRSIAETITNLGLNALLGYFFGVNGIIAATIFSLVMVNFLWGTKIVYKHYFKGISPRRFYIDELLYFVITIVACLISYVVVNMVVVSDGIIWLLVRLLIATVVSNVIFFGVYRLFPYYKDGKKLALNLLTRRLR